MDFAFLHGGDQGSWIWEGVVAALKQQSSPDAHRFHLLDVPGCGTKRGRDTADIAFPDIAAELIADIRAAGLRDIIVVGHSQAGTVLPDLLALEPALFRRAIYVSCSIPNPGQNVLQMVFAMHDGQDTPVARSFRNAAVPRSEQQRHMFCNDMTADESDAFLALLGQDSWPPSSYAWTDWHHADRPAVPASFVVCLQDTILPPDWQYRFAERFGADRTPRIDAGHQAMTTRPHALAEILLHEAKG
ncbi:hypothetical protein BH10PSE13_BH10PSE13_17520 [soil metagenome]